MLDISQPTVHGQRLPSRPSAFAEARGESISWFATKARSLLQLL